MTVECLKDGMGIGGVRVKKKPPPLSSAWFSTRAAQQKKQSGSTIGEVVIACHSGAISKQMINPKL